MPQVGPSQGPGKQLTPSMRRAKREPPQAPRRYSGRREESGGAVAEQEPAQEGGGRSFVEGGEKPNAAAEFCRPSFLRMK